jgi:SAM-dependent methyltransferase
MTKYSVIEAQLEPFDGPQFDLSVDRMHPAELEGYSHGNLDRDYGPLYSAFSQLDGRGPRQTLAEICETRPGSVAVLDAGCGTANQVTGLVVSVADCFDIDISRFQVDAVSDYDFSRFSRNRMTRVAIGAGLVNYVVGDLNTLELPRGAYDLAYSYEVLVHNGEPERIVDNMWQGLKPGGVAYFNADGSQVARLDRHVNEYRRLGAGVISQEAKLPPWVWVPSECKDDTRQVYKLVKPADF